MDYQGGSGNGLAWYAASDAVLTNSPLYQKLSQTKIKNQDVPTLKALIGEMYGSTEAAPLMNYVRWVLSMSEAIA